MERLCPTLAKLLASSWTHGTVLWARTGARHWACQRSYRGGAQGRLSTQVAFCAHVHEVFGSVRGLQPPGVVRVGIVDDQYIVGSPAASWPEPEHALADAGYEMRRHKCKAWAPERKAGLSLGAEMRLGLRTQLIPESEGSLALLGAAAEGKWSTILGPFAAAAGPARERARRAEGPGGPVCARPHRRVLHGAGTRTP